MHKKPGARSPAPLLALPFGVGTLTGLSLLLAVSSTVKAHIPRLAHSKLTRFVPVLTFICPGEQSIIGHPPASRGGCWPHVPYITGCLHGLLIWGELWTCPWGTGS